MADSNEPMHSLSRFMEDMAGCALIMQHYHTVCRTLLYKTGECSPEWTGELDIYADLYM